VKNNLFLKSDPMKTKRSPHLDLETIMPILIGVWRRFHKEAGPSDVLQTREFRRVVDAVKILLEKSENGKSLIGEDYFQKPELLGAYLLYQWVVHYQEGMSLIGEIPIAPNRVLDVCSGPSPFAFAALRHGANEVFATDRNQQALTLGAEVCGRYGLPLNIRRWNCLNERFPLEKKFDLIIAGYCLEELFPHNETARYKFISSLLEQLTSDGFLLIVDSSFPDANSQLLRLRDQLVKNGVPIQAPCVWRGECPALKTANSPCYAQRDFEKPYLIKEIQRSANINLGSLKMSYLLLRSPHSLWPVLPEQNLYRVISPPVDSFQGKRYYLCGTDGKKNLGTHLKSHPPQSRAFEFLKRGELISIENALEKNQAFDVLEETVIKIQAARGKPLNEISTES
jgi:Mitochondrial small ribosomal subunit Rsm22